MSRCSPRPRVRSASRRRAVIMAAVLVCLLVIMLLGAALVQTVVFQHRQTRSEQQQLQALWLAEAGAELAAARLAADADYRGETWQVAAAESGLSADGAVQIDIEPVAGKPDLRRLQIAARWPDDPVYRVVHRHEIILPLPDPGEAP